MTQLQIKNIFILVSSCIFFFIDIMLFAFMQQHQCDLLLCFFIMLIITHRKKRTLIVPLFLLSIISYLDFNIFGWSLIYIMPTMMLAYYLDQNLRVKIIIPFLLLITSLSLKILIAWYTHEVSMSLQTIIQTIIYNLIIMGLLMIMSHSLEKKFEINE